MTATIRLQAALDALPHRAPFRFVSELRILVPGVRAEGVWTVSGTEDFFTGHFPGEPIVPGVLLGEALAQLAGLVLHATGAAQPRATRLARVDLKFPSAVRPPASVELSATLTRALHDLALFDVLAMIGETPAAAGQVVLAAGAGGSP